MKIFNTLDEILEFTGCNVAIPTNHPLGKYAVFEVVEPYNCKYLDWATGVVFYYLISLVEKL